MELSRILADECINALHDKCGFSAWWCSIEASLQKEIVDRLNCKLEQLLEKEGETFKKCICIDETEPFESKSPIELHKELSFATGSFKKIIDDDPFDVLVELRRIHKGISGSEFDLIQGKLESGRVRFYIGYWHGGFILL